MWREGRTEWRADPWREKARLGGDGKPEEEPVGLRANEMREGATCRGIRDVLEALRRTGIPGTCESGK